MFPGQVKLVVFEINATNIVPVLHVLWLELYGALKVFFGLLEFPKLVICIAKIVDGDSVGLIYLDALLEYLYRFLIILLRQ